MSDIENVVPSRVSIKKGNSSRIVSDAEMNVEANELEEYCKKRGLCPLCTKTRTRKRVFQLFKRKNRWELLTIQDKEGTYQVYKGYCVKPTCFTLEQAKRMSGEIVVPTNDSRKRQMHRKLHRERSASHPSSTATSHSDNDSYDGSAANCGVHKTSPGAFPPPELRNTNNFASSENEPYFVIQKAVEGLANNSNTIRILELSGLKLRLIDYEALAGGLVASTNLSSLILENSQLDDEKLTIIAAGLERAHDVPLTKLYLRSNHVGDQGVSSLCPFLQANTSLEKLDVSRNCLTSLGAVLIFSAFRQNRLTRIRSMNLSHNSISDIHDESSGIEPFLGKNRSLRILNLEANKLGDPSVQALAEGLKKNEDTSLEQLFLGGNHIGDNGAIALANMLEENITLRVIGLGNNEIQNAGARALLAALDVNTTIKDISGLWSNLIERRFLIVAIRKLLLTVDRSQGIQTGLHAEGMGLESPLSPVDMDFEVDHHHRESAKFGIEAGTVVSTMTNDPDYGDPLNGSDRHHPPLVTKHAQIAHALELAKQRRDQGLQSLELTVGPPYDRLVVYHSTPIASLNRETGFYQPLPLMDSDHEGSIIQQALSRVVMGKIDMEVRVATLDRFTEFFKQAEAHILHISCSGPLDRLTLENGYGTVHTLSNDEMKQLLLLTKGELKVVVVTSRHANAIGQELIAAGVPHVVCCEWDHTFRDPVAINFVHNLYRALAEKKTLKRAFQIARLTASASSRGRLLRRVLERFQLLPVLADNNPYHNIPVFFAQLVPPMETIFRPPELFVPSLPSSFLGREIEMFTILEALRGDEIIRIVGPQGSGKDSVVAAVCRYAWKRRELFAIDHIFWLPPNEKMVPTVDSLYSDLCMCTNILKEAVTNVWDTDDTLMECRERIQIELEELNIVVVFDGREFQTEASQEGLEKFIAFLLQGLNVKILVIETRGSSDGLSAISHLSRDTASLSNGDVVTTIEVHPLSFKYTACLFGDSCKFINNSGCPAAHNGLEFADLLEPTPLPDSVKITQRQFELYARMGNGLPSTIVSEANGISKKDFVDLIGIANRPEAIVDSLGALEMEVQRRTQEQLQAVDDMNYLRAFYLDELLVELEMMRLDFPSLEDLKVEEESIKSQLDEAVINRRYDVANGLKRELLSIKKKIIKEQWSGSSKSDLVTRKETTKGPSDDASMDRTSLVLARNEFNGTFAGMTFAVSCGDHRDCSFVVCVGQIWDFDSPSSACGIVCWTNECCELEGTRVGGELLRRGGSEFRHELSELPFVSEETPYGRIRCATGNAVLVGPGEFGTLKPPCIILAVGPLSCSSTAPDDDAMTSNSLSYTKAMLRSCYRSSMVLAKHSDLQALALALSTPREENPAYLETIRVGLETLIEEAPFTNLRDLHLIARTPLEAFRIVEALRGMGHRQIYS